MITARFTEAQARTLWVVCDTAMMERLTQGDRRDAAKWKRTRDKFPAKHPTGKEGEK